jgi:hypothetical protein
MGGASGSEGEAGDDGGRADDRQLEPILAGRGDLEHEPRKPGEQCGQSEQ